MKDVLIILFCVATAITACSDSSKSPGAVADGCTPACVEGTMCVENLDSACRPAPRAQTARPASYARRAACARRRPTGMGSPSYRFECRPRA